MNNLRIQIFALFFCHFPRSKWSTRTGFFYVNNGTKQWKPKAIRDKEAAEAKAAAEAAAQAEEAKKAEELKTLEKSSNEEEDKSVVKAVTATDVSQDKIVDAVAADVVTDAVPVTVQEPVLVSTEEKKPADEPELAKTVEQEQETPQVVVTADTVAPESTVQVAAEVVVVAADPVAIPAVVIDEKPAEALVVEEPAAV